MRYGYGYFEEEQLGRMADFGLWRRILGYIAPLWRAVAAAVLLSLVISAADLTLPHLIRLAIDGSITNRELPAAARSAGLARFGALFVAMILVGFAANFYQVLILERTGQRIMHRMRQDLFIHLIGLDLGFFNANPVGKLVTRLSNDIQNMHEMFTSVIVTLFNDLMRVVGILIILFYVSPKLALLLCALLPPMLVATPFFSRLARRAFRGIRTHLARINSYLQEALSGMDIIQLFARQPDAERHYVELNQAYFKQTLYQIKVFAFFIPLIEVLSATALVIIIWIGGRGVLQGELTVGIVVAFFSYMRLFFQPLRELSQKYSIVQSAMASAERIFQLLDTRAALALPQQPAELPDSAAAIALEGVTFGYDPAHPVLHDFTLRVRPRETLAVVGATGSGKTTIINLLERFHDPDRGSIRIDDIDLRRLDPQAWRRRIGLVMQDVFIVPASFRENILLDQQLPPADLEKILAMAQLDRLVAALPQGLDTRIGDGGQNLSAGQKQLLAIARVLARDPGMLILDEATSNIDSETELLIERAIAGALANRTSIVIAHRLSTIRRADRIIVMDQGRIKEQGSHDQLLAERGLYHYLLTLQNGLRVD